jgi:hypothetical protein
MSTTVAPSITCPRCRATSHHPEDVRQRYCARCRWWTSDPLLGSAEVIAMAERDGVIEPVPL